MNQWRIINISSVLKYEVGKIQQDKEVSKFKPKFKECIIIHKYRKMYKLGKDI